MYTLLAEGGGTGPITYGMVETDKFFVDRATGEVKLRRLLDYEVNSNDSMRNKLLVFTYMINYAYIGVC